MVTPSFFGKNHAYLHVSLPWCSVKTWSTSVLLAAIPTRTSRADDFGAHVGSP